MELSIEAPMRPRRTSAATMMRPAADQFREGLGQRRRRRRNIIPAQEPGPKVEFTRVSSVGVIFFLNFARSSAKWWCYFAVAAAACSHNSPSPVQSHRLTTTASWEESEGPNFFGAELKLADGSCLGLALMHSNQANPTRPNSTRLLLAWSFALNLAN